MFVCSPADFDDFLPAATCTPDSYQDLNKNPGWMIHDVGNTTRKTGVERCHLLFMEDDALAYLKQLFLQL